MTNIQKTLWGNYLRLRNEALFKLNDLNGFLAVQNLAKMRWFLEHPEDVPDIPTHFQNKKVRDFLTSCLATCSEILVTHADSGDMDFVLSLSFIYPKGASSASFEYEQDFDYSDQQDEKEETRFDGFLARLLGYCSLDIEESLSQEERRILRVYLRLLAQHHLMPAVTLFAYNEPRAGYFDNL